MNERFYRAFLSVLILRGSGFTAIAPVLAEDPAPLQYEGKQPSAADLTLPESFPARELADSPPPETPVEPSETRYTLTPLQLFPTRLVNVETANTLPAGSLMLSVGSRVFSRGDTGSGTGLQVYSASIDGGVSDRLQLGLGVTFFDDRLGRSFQQGVPYLGILNFAPNFKYRFLENEKFSLAVAGSLEIGKFTGSNGLYTRSGQGTSTTVGGSLQVPFTYNLSPTLQGHLVPGIIFWPDSINNGGDFYGTFLNLGAGLNFRPIDRVTLFTDLNIPVTSGNAVNTRGSIVQELVWSAGLTYLHSPAVALDVYATNSLGSTPATRPLAFIPDGGEVALGVNLRYTPDLGRGYPTSFRRTAAPLSSRDRQLLFNGITVTSPETLVTGMVSLQGGTGAGLNFQLSYGLSDDAQFLFVGQQLGDNDTSIDDNSFKVGAYSKLRFLSQKDGDPFSLSLAGGFEQGTDTGGGGGLFSAELAFLYRIDPRLALVFNPKAGFYGSDSQWGAGFGINYEVWNGIQLIGEVTPIISGEVRDTIWATGIRYLNPEWNAGIDLYATNAAGTYGIGGLIGRSNDRVTVGFNILWLLGGK